MIFAILLLISGSDALIPANFSLQFLSTCVKHISLAEVEWTTSVIEVSPSAITHSGWITQALLKKSNTNLYDSWSSFLVKAIPIAWNFPSDPVFPNRTRGQSSLFVWYVESRALPRRFLWQVICPCWKKWVFFQSFSSFFPSFFKFFPTLFKFVPTLFKFFPTFFKFWPSISSFGQPISSYH